MTTPGALTATGTIPITGTTISAFVAPGLMFIVYDAGALFFKEDRGVCCVSPGPAPVLADRPNETKTLSARTGSPPGRTSGLRNKVV